MIKRKEDERGKKEIDKESTLLVVRGGRVVGKTV